MKFESNQMTKNLRVSTIETNRGGNFEVVLVSIYQIKPILEFRRGIDKSNAYMKFERIRVVINILRVSTSANPEQWPSWWPSWLICSSNKTHISTWVRF